MKVEQACRFRLDEGYCIFAKSAGLKPAQEEALGDAFNSTMNTIFPKPGASVLSCTLGKNDAFLARNTLRTDVLGRKTIFTHAYIFSAEEYARHMEENPQVLLSIPMEQLLDSQAPGAQMEQTELNAPADGEMVLEDFFAKYNLTPERYGKLLMGSYEAMTSNASLRLKTNLPLERTEQMVREMTYCILDGLLPVLRGKISFSSGADTRMNISVIPGGDNAVQSSDIVFGVEDDRYTNIRPKDEVSAIAFEALGRASHAERHQALQNMQYWLAEVTNIQEGLSVMLVSAAYCMSSGRALSQDTILMLFRSISTAAKGFSPYVANGLLTGLVKQMNEQGSCGSKALSQIAGWYLKDSTASYREEADRAFDAAPIDICVALVEAVFMQDMTDNVRQMLHALLKRIPPESGALSENVQNQVVLWILSENVEQFSNYAAVLLRNYNNDQMLHLARGILSGIGGRMITSSEDVMLAKALHRLTGSNISLNEEECTLLDSLSRYYSDELMNSALDYLFSVRFAGKGIQECLNLLETLSVQQPQYFALIYKELSGGTRNSAELWEYYQAKHCFHASMTMLEIEHVCSTANTFNNPCGVFEECAAVYWLSLVEADFVSYQENAQLQYYFSVLLKRWLEKTAELKVSTKMQKRICGGIVRSFWNSITYRQIFSNEYPLPDVLRKVPAEAQQKLQVLDLCLGLRKDPTDTKKLIELIQSEQTDDGYRRVLIKCANSLMVSFLKKHYYLSWDLVLLTCWEQTEKEGNVNLDKLFDLCEILDQCFRKQYRRFRIEAADSLLLQDEKLAKSICKLGNDVPDVLGQLIEQLKAGKKGLLQNIFGGSGSREKKAPDMSHGGKIAAGTRRDSGKSRVFDPTAVSYGDDDWYKKKGKGRQ